MSWRAAPPTLLAALVALPAGAAPQGFQAACARLAGDAPVAIVACGPADGRLRALVHPELAGSPHPPGSVFKLVTALAALDAGLAPPGQTFVCRGWYRPPGLRGQPLRCWKTGGHGAVGLEEALSRSCNLTFCQLATRLGPAAVLDAAARAGVGAAPGWRRPPRGVRAAAELGIGEGEAIAATPLQLAGLVGAIATGSPPRLPAWDPAPAHGPPLAPPAALSRLRAGLRGAVLFGSARSASLPGLAIAGKTGTATFTDGSHRTSGWFVGYAPAEAPALAIAVYVREGSGFGEAARLGREVFARWVAAGRP